MLCGTVQIKQLQGLSDHPTLNLLLPPPGVPQPLTKNGFHRDEPSKIFFMQLLSVETEMKYCCDR